MPKPARRRSSQQHRHSQAPGAHRNVELPQTLATEHDRRHPDVARVIPVVHPPSHLSGRVGRQRGEDGPLSQSLDEPGRAAGPEDHVVVQQEDVRGRPESTPLVAGPRDRRETIGIVRIPGPG